MFAQLRSVNIDNSISNYQNTTEVPYLEMVRVDPIVVRTDIDTYNIFITVNNNEINKIELSAYYNVFISFYDDGINSDKNANDLIFTSESQIYNSNEWTQLAKTGGGSNTGKLKFYFNDGHSEEFDNVYCGSIRYIDADFFSSPVIQKLGEKEYATEYVYNVVLDEIFGEYPYWYFGDSKLGLSNPYYSKFRYYYERFPDDRDFLLTPRLASSLGAYAAAGFGDVVNTVEGTGIITDDRRIEYGTNVSRLTGDIGMYLPDGENLNTIKHEILHNWALGLDGSLGIGNYGGHWDAVEFQNSGFEPANNNHIFYSIGQIDENKYLCKDVVYRTNNYKYNDIELYLMGFKSADEIESPFKVLVNPTYLEYSVSDSGAIYTADSMKFVSIEDIIAVEGPRIPTSTNSQKEFSAALIVAYDRPLTEIEFAYYDYFMRELEKEHSDYRREYEQVTFYEATGGLGRLKTKILSFPTSVEQSNSIVSDFYLYQNYPNPFNPTTEIKFDISNNTMVNLSIYDMLGRRLQTLVNEYKSSGSYKINFNANNLSSGIYFYTLKTDEKMFTKKMLLIK